VQLSHHRAGSGEPVVLIHGVGSQWQVWAPVLPALERERDVIALDLPGFGGSPSLPIGVVPDAPALASAVVDFLDGLGVERPVAHVPSSACRRQVSPRAGSRSPRARI
jgi:pimeloyl-ACP methyl ester carboxylesterase